MGLEAISVLLKVIKTLKSFEHTTNHKLYYNDSYCWYNPSSSIESKYSWKIYWAVNKYEISGIRMSLKSTNSHLEYQNINMNTTLLYTVLCLAGFPLTFRILLINHFIKRGKVQLYIDKLPGGVWCKVFKLKGIS